MPTLRLENAVHVLDLGEDENRFSPDWLTTVHKMLDEVVDAPRPTALVTIGQGKFYSNGLDLQWLSEHGNESAAYLGAVHELLARMLVLPVPSIAAINGHAFGAGAMFAIAHDFRVMRTDRGYFCFPEVDMKIPFTTGMVALMQSKLTPAAAVASMTTGHKFTGPQARDAGLVDDIAELPELTKLAAQRIGLLTGKDQATLAAIKQTMFASAVTALRSLP